MMTLSALRVMKKSTSILSIVPNVVSLLAADLVLATLPKLRITILQNAVKQKLKLFKTGDKNEL